MAQTSRRGAVDDQELIERYIDPEWDRTPAAERTPD